MRRIRTWVPAALGLFVACGGGGNNQNVNLTSQPPYLATLQAGSSVRNIVVTQYPGLSQATEPAACTIEADLFDVNMAASRTAIATDGECALYAATPDLPITSQNWICAGAILADFNSMVQNLVICPSSGTMLRPTSPLDCNGLAGGGTVTISSSDELTGDVVTDLNTSITLPANVAITAPTALGVLTWPASGTLAVQWTSANATAALVTLAERNPTTPGPTIVCHPTVNGVVAISPALIDQATLRMHDAMLRVYSYTDTTTTAESGKTYHVWGGTEGALMLQGLR